LNRIPKGSQIRFNLRRLVFIDETWIKTNMAPLRGWGDRGKRLITHVPYGHWPTMTFIGALRHDGIEAPWVLVAQSMPRRSRPMSGPNSSRS
jgi:hypothetical protein